MATTTTNNVGHFTAQNIAAILRALPETDATYDKVITKTREYGGQVSKHTLAKWLANGRSDIKANKRQTAFARFAQKHDQIKTDHCAPDANRTREFGLALQILERTCDCGNEKMTMPDGSLADSCRQCHEIETQNDQRKRSTRSTGRHPD